MPRRKISMGLIPNCRVRANTFAKRKEGLKKKARELATLCGVRVAVVCAAAADSTGSGSGSAADVWESAPGVLDAYRDLLPEERAKHTHLAYAELELRKAEAKLAKVRQDGPAALAPWDAAVYGLTPDQAERMLAAVDGALQAVNERRAALGMPADDGGGGWLKAVFAAPAAGASDSVLPQGLAAPPPFVGTTGSDLVSMHGYLLRAQAGNANEQAMWDNSFDPCSAAMNWQPCYASFQQCGADVYGNNSNSISGRIPWDAFHPPANATVAMQQAGYGMECNGRGNSYVGMTGYLPQQQMPSNAIVPLGYHASLEMGLLTGGNFFNAAPAALSLTMGTGGDNFFDTPQAQPLATSFYNGDYLVNGSDDYTSQWAAGRQAGPERWQQQATLGSTVESGMHLNAS